MPVTTDPAEKPIPPTPVTPTSFAGNTPQVIAGSSEAQIFPTVQTHLSTTEMKADGTSWLKILTITALLLLLLNGGVYGYNMWRGVENPDLLTPLVSLLNR